MRKLSIVIVMMLVSLPIFAQQVYNTTFYEELLEDRGGRQKWRIVWTSDPDEDFAVIDFYHYGRINYVITSCNVVMAPNDLWDMEVWKQIYAIRKHAGDNPYAIFIDSTDYANGFLKDRSATSPQGVKLSDCVSNEGFRFRIDNIGTGTPKSGEIIVFLDQDIVDVPSNDGSIQDVINLIQLNPTVQMSGAQAGTGSINVGYGVLYKSDQHIDDNPRSYGLQLFYSGSKIAKIGIYRGDRTTPPSSENKIYEEIQPRNPSRIIMSGGIKDRFESGLNDTSPAQAPATGTDTNVFIIIYTQDGNAEIRGQLNTP